MASARNLPSSPMNDKRSKDVEGRIFSPAPYTTVGEGDDSGTAESSLTDGDIVSILLNLGSNVRRTTHLDDLSKRKLVSKKFTFGTSQNYK